MTKTRWMARQGDVLMMEVDAIPAEAMAHKRPSDAGRTILAYGEVTGHCHALAEGQTVGYGPSDDAFWLEVIGDGAVVTHDEHAPITIPSHVRRLAIVRQREYSGAGERRVAD